MIGAPLLEGRVAIVTGASRGIGRSIAVELATAGAELVLHYRRDENSAREVAREIRAIGRSAEVVGGDVRSRRSMRDLVRLARARTGRIDVVVANAGIAEPGTLAEADPGSWERTLETNLRGPFELAREAAEPLRQSGGTFIAVASVAGLRPSTTEIPYHVSKAGLIMLVRCLALALAPQIRVNAVAPGWVETDMTRAEREDPVARESIRRATPLGRWGRPQDIGHAVVFLASDMARFLTGQILVVDGGESLHWNLEDPA